MNKAQDRVAKKSNSNKVWSRIGMGIPIILIGAWAFVWAKAPAPLDLNKLLSTQPAKSTYSPEEINLLNSLGFGQSETVKQNNLLLEWETKQAVAKKYGMNFISRTAFQQNILEKYNLKIAPLPAYTGAIPKENVIELNNALNKIDDIRKNDLKEKNEATMRQARVQNLGTWVDDGGVVRIERAGMIQIGGGEFQQSKAALKIVAPKSKLNLEGFEMRSLYEWSLPQPKDPIIVWEYASGYIILTAWDE